MVGSNRTGTRLLELQTFRPHTILATRHFGPKDVSATLLFGPRKNIKTLKEPNNYRLIQEIGS